MSQWVEAGAICSGKQRQATGTDSLNTCIVQRIMAIAGRSTQHQSSGIFRRFNLWEATSMPSEGVSPSPPISVTIGARLISVSPRTESDQYRGKACTCLQDGVRTS